MAISELFDLQAADVWPDSTVTVKSDIRSYQGQIERYLHGLLESYALPMINGRLVASVNSNVLTVALKTALDADATSNDPIHLLFRDATDGGDEVDRVAVGAALNVTVDAGADLGTSDGVAFRVWVVALNDGGTIRLGVVNLYDGNLYTLVEGTKRTSTALSAAGDAAGTIYTDTAIGTAAPFRILGYLTWDAGLTTAGMWDTAPSVIQMAGPLMPRPGTVIQRQRVTDTSSSTGTTALPADNSLPTTSEGDQYLTDTITAQSPANVMRCTANLQAGLSTAGTISAALNDGSTVIAARAADVAGSNDVVQITLNHEKVADDASALTYNLRMGPSTGTLRFNGNTAQLFSTAGISHMEIEEIFV